MKVCPATDCGHTVKNRFLLNENLMAMEFKFECPSANGDSNTKTGRDDDMNQEEKWKRLIASFPFSGF